MTAREKFEALPEAEKKEFFAILLDEARDMSTKDVAWLLLDIMGEDEFEEYMEDIY